jgi:hypothetical protein
MGKQSRTKRDRRLAKAALPAWTPFQEAIFHTTFTEAQIAQIVRESGRTEEEVRDSIYATMQSTVLVNSRYQVNLFRTEASDWRPEMVHLSIKRRDKEPVGEERFRDFQRIKNEIVGEEFEGVELYPAESRLCDTANQYHIWVAFDKGFRFDFGFTDRLVLGQTSGPAKQRPFEKD